MRTVTPLGALSGGDVGGGRAAPPELVKRLERAGLIVPIARDEAGRIWVDVDARRQLERVQALIGAGYAERDIALVIGKVERPERRARLEPVVGVEHLCQEAGASGEDVKRWLAEGLLEPWALTEAGDPILLPADIDLARALAALEALALGAHKAAWVAAVRTPKARIDAALRERITRLEAAAKTLRKLAATIDERAATRSSRVRLLSRRRKGTTQLSRR